MATVPVVFECSVSSAFLMDPNEHQRIGWVTKLDGFGLPVGGLRADLQVSDPLAAGNGEPLAVPVAGVIEKFSWAGGTGDPLQLDFFVSQENAFQIKALQQTTLKSAAVKALDFLIADYDQEAKAWFTALIPGQPLSGTITGKASPQLMVDMTPVPAKDGIDVNVYEASIAIAPPPHQVYALKMASGSTRTVAKSWGVA
ncbi:MAG TPA: hypothetical protein VFV73_44445 [Streptosporangiaceae bacterium]|nr:hypothetical protein [Streptosporangiaceae bacterium]